jgi:hypothetical protein
VAPEGFGEDNHGYSGDEPKWSTRMPWTLSALPLRRPYTSRVFGVFGCPGPVLARMGEPNPPPELHESVVRPR